jgi:cytoskeleton protein RodZ
MNETSMDQAMTTDDEARNDSADALRQHELQSHQQPQISNAGIGCRLAAEREARGWTVEQVASQLNLAARQIQALEHDNFSALPGMASVRGFIRAYAKLLKVDATPLIAMLATESAPPPIEPLHSRRPLTAPFSDEKHLPSNGARPPLSKMAMIAIGVVVLAAAAFVAYQFGGLHLPSMSQTSAEITTSAPSETATASAQSVPETPVQESRESADPSMSVARGNESPPSAPAPSVAPAVPTAVPTAPAAAPAPISAQPEKPAAAGKNTLVLKMREQSWIEVRRVGDAPRGTSNVLMSRLDKAGTTEAIEVTEPVTVTIGNAGGVDATLRGAPVDLKADAKSNVAHLNLK